MTATPLRYPATDHLEVSYSCPRCGEDVGWEDGLHCRPCGLTWGEDAANDGEIDSSWQYFLDQLSKDPDNPLSIEDGTHLMIYTEPSQGAPVSDHTWFAHYGCRTKSWSRRIVDCDFVRAIDDGQHVMLRGGMEIASGVTFGLNTLYGRDVAVLPSGVYRVELTGMALVSLRVVELVAAMPSDATDFDPDLLERHNPALTPQAEMRYHRPMITVNLPD